MKKLNTFDPNISVLTGGKDPHYSYGLASTLAAAGVQLDLIGGNEFEIFAWPPAIRFLNLRGDQCKNAGLLNKMRRVLIYYARLLLYAARSKARIFHILWNNKFELFDRTLLMVFYKMLGKKIAFTAHNINAGQRDGSDSRLNRASLRLQYRLCDLIFVHTNKMKAELLSEFGVPADKIVRIPFGINNAVPHTGMTREQARIRLGLRPEDKVLLFFGSIAPYKGLHYLVEAFDTIATHDPSARLMIAGYLKDHGDYWNQIQESLRSKSWRDRVIHKIEYIPDGEIEVYFKAADVSVLPYVHIFQSGIFFLAYSFGLPVIATDVGSLKEDIIEGETGMICEPRNAADLTRAIQKYFQSDLYRHPESRRREILSFANKKHSWSEVISITTAAYQGMLREVDHPDQLLEHEGNDETFSLNSHSGIQR
ncbi:MAG TPA: glycosyltransferase family 4 protein [Candidatus Sulfotelmatobacter sp.]|nr:glycosyltransferase family 4 protein [Candidatus Sulfotelmatobacter sp.]